jgi:acetylornithine deacetylase/succinyl-diaminopimelate desuccinylase-like protein
VVEPTVDIDLVARMALDLARRPGRAGSEIVRAEWLAGALRDVAGKGGPEVGIQRLGESRANVLIGPPTGPTLAFAGHLDTSLSGEPFEGRITGRRDPPRPPEVRDGVLWGLGMAVATAITVASALTALAVHQSLAASGRARASVGALITAGGTHRDLPPWPASDAGSTPDGTAFGMRAALEGGFRPGAVINAKGGAPGPLHEEPGSLYLAVEYREPWGPVLVWPVAESLRGAPARLGAVLGAIDRWRREHLAARSGRPGPGADVAVGAIDAGVPAKPDLIPATARLFLHVVLVPGDTAEEIAASLASTLRADPALEAIAPTITVEPYGLLPPGSTDPQHPLVRNAHAAWRAAFGDWSADGWRGATDGAYLRAAGIPTVRIGPRLLADPTDPRVDGVALDNLAAVAAVWTRVASTYLLGQP